ncbi:MAG: heme-binding domain-containing protein [Bryobacterales bacterium]|nr:heme-binding domain-containing protein [Bryobacterales bacterium]
MKRVLLWGLGAIGAAFAGIQFAPVDRSNPPSRAERGVDAHLDMAPAVRDLLRRSCHDCHSNDTRWPWYSYIAPASWMVTKDVEKARKVMNFSEWSEEAGLKLEKAVGLLMASCTDVKVGRMPKAEYVLMHSEAALNAAEVKNFCEWTGKEGGRLLTLRKKRPR